MMGLGSWLIWRLPEEGEDNSSSKRIVALKFYFAQLLVNLAWTPIFFGMHSILGALINIIILDALVIATIYFYFMAGSKLAVGLMIPYLAWILTATFLNIKFYRLNEM